MFSRIFRKEKQKNPTVEEVQAIIEERGKEKRDAQLVGARKEADRVIREIGKGKFILSEKGIVVEYSNWNDWVEEDVRYIMSQYGYDIVKTHDGWIIKVSDKRFDN